LSRSAFWRRDDVAVSAQQSGKGVLGGGLAVHQVYRQRTRTGTAHGGQPSLQLASVGVSAVAVENLHASAERDVFAEDGERRPALDDPATERVFRLETDDQNCVPRIRGPVRKVVENSSILDHSRRRDDDHRPVAFVERLGCRDVARVFDEIEMKEIVDGGG
jgi:hypothetical protein